LTTGDILGAIGAVVIIVVGLILIWRNAGKKALDPDELITIAQFANPTEAGLWESRLESQGIGCTVFGTGVRLNIIPSDACPAFSLQVRAGDKDKARKILNEGKISIFSHLD